MSAGINGKPSEHGVQGHSDASGAVPLLILIALSIAYTAFAMTQWMAAHGAARLGGFPWGHPAAGVEPILLYALVGIGIMVSSVMVTYPATQRFAGVGVFVSLSAYLFSLGPVYPFWKGAVWLDAAQHFPELEPLIYHGIGAAGLGILVCLGAGLPIALGKSDKTTGSHGTAGWSDGFFLQGKEKGMILGRKDGKFNRYDGSGHLMTVAATRTGKGVGTVIPNLLDHPGSVIVTDLKGENYQVTGKYRRETLGQPVHALDPFASVTDDPSCYNPLDIIQNGSDDAGDDANMLAYMMVMKEGSGSNNSHFVGEARNFLAGLMLYVCGTESSSSPLRSLPYLFELTRLPQDEEMARPNPDYYDPDYEDGPRPRRDDAGEHTPAERLELGLDEKGRPLTFNALLADMARKPELFSGRVANAANQLSQKPARERGSVISTFQQNTNFLGSVRMKRTLCRSDFDLNDLKKTFMSLYLVLPPHRIDTYKRWLRMIVSCGITAVARTPGTPKERILFLLDEFANLGYMKPVLTAYSIMAGYGMSLWIILQDLSQLKGKYKDEWHSFTANADVLQTFSNSDPMTTKHVSEQIGKTTIYVKSQGDSSGVSGGGWIGNSSHNESENVSEKGRSLLTPDEVRRFPDGEQILLVRGENPIRADKIRYYEEDPFQKRAEPNPMYEDVEEHADEKTSPQHVEGDGAAGKSAGEPAAPSGDGAAPSGDRSASDFAIPVPPGAEGTAGANTQKQNGALEEEENTDGEAAGGHVPDPPLDTWNY